MVFGGAQETYYAQVSFVRTVGQDYRYPFADLEGTLTEVGYPRNPKFSFRGEADFASTAAAGGGSDRLCGPLGQRTLVPCRVSSIEQYNNFQPTPYEVGSDAYQRVLRKLDGTY